MVRQACQKATLSPVVWHEEWAIMMLTDVPDCMHGPAFQVLLLAFSSLVHVNDACHLPA